MREGYNDCMRWEWDAIFFLWYFNPLSYLSNLNKCNEISDIGQIREIKPRVMISSY